MKVLVLLARAPQPGKGKSRLRRSLDGATVDRLCAALVVDTLAWAETAGDLLLVAHDGASPLFHNRTSTVRTSIQTGGDLGARIAAAVDLAFETGGTRVVVIGSDSPTLPGRLLAGCFRGLESHDATLIPAEDGGWVALGTTRPLGSTLAGVTWSAPSTAAETLEALRRDTRRAAVLDPWYDIDDLQSLRRVRTETGATAGRAPRTTAVLDEIDGRLG